MSGMRGENNMKKNKIPMISIVFAFAVLLTLLPANPALASETPAKLSAKDFTFTVGDKKVNFLKEQAILSDFYSYFWTAGDTDNVSDAYFGSIDGMEFLSDVPNIRTYRNAELGSTESYIKEQYGKTKKIKVNKKEKLYKCIKYDDPHVDTSIWKNYLEYTYKKGKDTNGIRFYLNEENKAAAIYYLRNLKDFREYPNIEVKTKLSFVPPKGTEVTQKMINGKKVYILPKGTKIRYKNYSKDDYAEYATMIQWDKHVQEIEGAAAQPKEEPVLDAKKIKELHRIDVNLDDYLYISLKIENNSNENKYAPKMYYFKFE